MEFPFPCLKCKNPICRRAYNLNLALGYIEEQFCLNCLSETHNQTKEDLFDYIFDYIQSRNCFKKEWDKMTSKNECPLPDKCVIGKCFK